MGITTMPDELAQLCAREFARHIDELFGKYRIETFSDGPDWVEPSLYPTCRRFLCSRCF
jgi:hypothetical protein